jgi:alpha-L-arabinofuranosidase
MKKIKFTKILLATLLLGLFFSKPAFAANHTLSGSIKDSSGDNISGATVSITNASTNANVGNTTSDSLGNYTFIVEEGIYNIQVIPPAGNNFSPATALNQNISSDKVLNFVLVPVGSATLNGHVYGPLGNPLPNQAVNVYPGPVTTTTDASGAYSITTTSGQHTLIISGSNNNSSLNISPNYQVSSTIDLSQSITEDITIPEKKVNIHVQDTSGNPQSDVQININGSSSAANNGHLVLANNLTQGSGGSTYNGPTTDASGNALLWVIPNNDTFNNQYDFTAIPPSGSPYKKTTLNGISILNDTNLTITLQQPVTLSGHIYGPLGNPLPNQSVSLFFSGNKVSATTDDYGVYSLPEVSPGQYVLVISGTNNNSSLNVSPNYQVSSSITLTQSKTEDITIREKKVTIHVQDAAGNSQNGIQITVNGSPSAANNGHLVISTDLTQGNGGSTYPSPGISTDSSGNALVWLVPNSDSLNNAYSFIATPPSGSLLQTTTLNDVSILDDTNLTINLKQPVTLSGHIYGPLGNSLPNQSVKLFSQGTDVSTTTDINGAYSLPPVSSGQYSLIITGDNNDFSLNVSPNYQIITNINLTQTKTEDIIIPEKKVTVHVQDALSNPQSGVQINVNGSSSAANNGQLILSGDLTQGTGGSTYNGRTTDSSGNAILWMIPTSSTVSNLYNLIAIPPIGSPYSSFTLSDVVVTSDQTELISLQYNHSTPVTSLNLATQRPDGTYANPATITLSATASSGYTITNTYYTIDEGAQKTYSSPFTVSGIGTHTITYWSTDNSGVQETHNSKTFTITPPTPQLTSLNPAKVWIGLKNSDDIGIKLDLKAEIYKDTTLINSGQINSVPGGSSGFSHARLNTIPFNTFSPIDFPSGSQLSLKLYARNACNGSGKNSGTARLWYNDSQANSKFTATISANTSDYFLLNNSALGTSAGAGPKLTSDLSAGAKCSPFKSFGTWTITP